MDTNTICLKALIRHAEKLPKDALPHLGCLAYPGLWFPKAYRRRLFRGIAAIFNYTQASHKKGMKLLLMDYLDFESHCDLVRAANWLRRTFSHSGELQETVRLFFAALEKATVLCDYYNLTLNLYEPYGEVIPWSIMDGTAFVKGGAIYNLIVNSMRLPQAVLSPTSLRPALHEEAELLNFTEQCILEALKDKTAKGEDIAHLAGYPYDGHFKGTLARLVKRRILGNKRPGYYRL